MTPRFPGKKPTAGGTGIQDILDLLGIDLGDMIESIILLPISWLLALLLGGSADDWNSLEEIGENFVPALVKRILGPLGNLVSTGDDDDIDSDTKTSLLDNIPILGNVVKALQGITTGLVGGLLTAAGFQQATANTASTAASAASANTAAIATINATLADIDSASPTTPAYVADIEDMATIPRASLIAFTASSTSSDSHSHAKGSLSANTTTGTITGSTASDTHNHTVSLSTSMPTYKPDRVFTTGTASSYADYTPIVVDRSGALKVLRWIGGADTSLFDVDDYRMGLYAYNPSTGNLDPLWVSSNLKSATNLTALQELQVNMGITANCTPGQILFVGHLQLAPGLAQDSRSFAAVPQAGISRPSSLLLDASSYRSPSRLTALPSSSFAFSSLTRVNSRIPWAAVSVDTSGA